MKREVQRHEAEGDLRCRREGRKHRCGYICRGIVRRWVEEAVTEILMLSEWLEALSLSPLSLTAASPCGPTAAFCGEGTTVAGLLLNSPAVCLGVTDSP